ncbi:MAG: alkaline phosphatase, partial [Victivallaceae bacterium]
MMLSMWKRGAALLLLAVLMVNAAAGEPVKYVFLFIGDGMSLPQRMLVEEFCRVNGRKGLAMNALPVQGVTTTYAANAFITDSAAAGTALATGSKTNSGFLGVDPQGKDLESVAAIAKRNGRK